MMVRSYFFHARPESISINAPSWCGIGSIIIHGCPVQDLLVSGKCQWLQYLSIAVWHCMEKLLILTEIKLYGLL